MDLILVPKLLLRITAVVVVSCSASYGKSNNRMRIIARLRGACGVVPRPIPSLAVVWGRQFAPPPFAPLLAMRLQAERIACSWFSSTWKSCGVM